MSRFRGLRRSLGKAVRRSVEPSERQQIDALTGLVEAQQDLMREQTKILSDLRWEAQQMRKYQNAIWLAVTRDTCNDVEEFAADQQMELMQTVKHLADTGCSFARFGDGELRTMLRHSFNLRFQKNSPALRSALRGVLESTNPDLLLGFPAVYRDQHGSAVWSDIWAQLKPMVEGKRVFGNSHVSRPLFFQQYGEEGVDAWRKVWSGLDLCIVTGRNSRFETVPALFSSARSIRFVDSSASNAFSNIDRLMSRDVLGHADLFLVSLGPAGTVLAHELSNKGYRALDVGHISDSYLNVFEGGAWPESKPMTRD